MPGCEGYIIREIRDAVEESVSPSSDADGWLARHGDALYRYALLRLRSSHAAEDVVQETLLAALDTRGRPEGFRRARARNSRRLLPRGE